MRSPIVNKYTLIRRLFLIVVSLAFGVGSSFNANAATGNSFMYADLRVDQSSVSGARDYITNIWVGGAPSNGGNEDFTTGWLSINAAQSNGSLYSAQFAQVGIKTSKFGVRWFVFAETDITCLEGTKVTWPNEPITECRGDYGARVKTGAWHKAELVTYGQGYWIARIWDYNGVAKDVALIHYSSQTIYRAGVVTEEGYVLPNPHILASFWHHDPRYMQWGSGFQTWPASASGGTNIQKNRFFTVPASECSTYYIGRLNWSGNPRFWYAGSSGLTPATCSNPSMF